MRPRLLSVQPGERFGSLEVIREAAVRRRKNGGPARQVECRCDCGTIKLVPLANLTGGRTRSCGCRRSTVCAALRTTHGRTGTRIYGIWNGMRSRCANPRSKSFATYGALGVTVCAEWATFEPFRDWALANGYRDDLTIDRINPFGNYEPTNCRWIPKSEQRHNRRDSQRAAP